jgi:threonine/homoserine/homoserine lactone efflux protein
MIGRINLRAIGGIPVIYWGLGISFLGSIPLGMMNVSVLQTAAQKGLSAGIQFSLGAILIEMLAVRILLVGTGRFLNRPNWFAFFRGLTLLLLTVLAMGSFWAAFQPVSFKSAPILWENPFLSGMVFRLVALNMIPFWIGCNTALLSKSILLPLTGQFNQYVVGIGIGSLLAHLLYAWGGNLTANLFIQYHFEFNILVGLVFLGTAIGIVFRKSSSS